MSRKPDLNLLPVFVAVAETWSISAAARRLELPKSSVSRGIASLESALGVQLFHRTTRKVALTTAGTAFYEKARPIVASLRDLTGSLPEQEDEPSGELRITCPVDMGLNLLPAIVAGFSTRHPGVVLDVRPTNRFVDLVGEGFDAGLRVAQKLADSGLMARKISALEAGLYASPTYVARRGQPRNASEAGTHDWIVLRQMKVSQIGILTHPRLFTDDLLFAHRAVREGLGLCILPTFLAKEDVAAGLLVRVMPSWVQPAGNLYFVYPRTEHVPRKVTAFRDFLLAYLGANPL
ncbi:MAG: LysR family transcriptional regulator [Myxococcota bacterium]|nr:LysR family transcriptional regulator [Myxococcota bacterium]